MQVDFRILLWLLKLGAPLNLWLLADTLRLPSEVADAHVVVPAQILFVISAYRCLFPNRYEDNVVLHDTPLASTLITRLLATLVEVAWIYQLSYVIRSLNLGNVVWVDALSWLMVGQAVLSQGFVWGAILTGRLALYVYEELGWALIFAANTAASAFLHWTVDSLDAREVLLRLNLLFGLVYLPWQILHLRALRVEARNRDETDALTWRGVASRLRRSFHERKPSTDAASWGGYVGLTWMTAYWASLIPLWVHQVVVIFSH